MWFTGLSKDLCLFLSGKLKSGGVQVYTAEGLFATNKDLGGSLKNYWRGWDGRQPVPESGSEPTTMRLANRKTKRDKSRF